MSLWSREEQLIKTNEKLVRRHSDARTAEDSNLKGYSGRTLGSSAPHRAGRATPASVLTALAEQTVRGGGRAVEVMTGYVEPIECRTLEAGMR